MALKRGFLLGKNKFEPKNLVSSILIWFISSYIYYAFFQLFRETFRVLTASLGETSFVYLDSNEIYLYNLFYASIAAGLGFLNSTRFTLQNSFYSHKWRVRFKIRNVLNTEGYYTWTFLFWFGKLGGILGIWYLISSLQYDIDFIKEFAIFLFLLPLILFYSIWPGLSLLIKENKARWFFSISTLFFAMSFGLAFKNFMSFEKVNMLSYSKSIEHVYKLKVPESQSQQLITGRNSLADIYLVLDTIDKEEPILFVNNINRRINLENISKALSADKNMISPTYFNYLIPNLHVDKEIPLFKVNPLLEEIRKTDISKVQFSTVRKFSKYPPEYPAFRNAGIQRNLFPPFYEDFSKFLDSIEQVDLEGKKFKLADSFWYRNAWVKKNNRIEISVDSDYLSLNGQKVSALKLEKAIFQFVKKYSPNYIIIFDAKDDISFGRYIEFLDLTLTQIDRLRNNLSNDLWNEPYSQFRFGMDTIKSQYPYNILQWTNEEKRLNALIKKTEESVQ